MQTLWQDLRFGARMLLKQPGFTLIAVVTLALGIGVNTALFTGFNLLLRPKPIKDPDTVVKLEERSAARRSFAWADYLSFREHAQSFSAVLPSYEDGFLLGATTAGVGPEVIYGVFVSESYLSELGGHTRLGRFFTAEENRVAGRDAVDVEAAVVVLGLEHEHEREHDETGDDPERAIHSTDVGIHGKTPPLNTEVTLRGRRPALRNLGYTAA